VLDIQRLPHVQAVDDVRDVEHRGEAIAGLRPVGKGCAPDAEQRQGARQILRMLGRIGAFRQGDVDSVRTAAAFAANALEVEIDAIGLARGAAGRRQRPQALDYPRRGRPVESHARVDRRRAKLHRVAGAHQLGPLGHAANRCRQPSGRQTEGNRALSERPHAAQRVGRILIDIVQILRLRIQHVTRRIEYRVASDIRHHELANARAARPVQPRRIGWIGMLGIALQPDLPQPVDVRMVQPEDGIEGCRHRHRHQADILRRRRLLTADFDVHVVVRLALEHAVATAGMVETCRHAAEAGRAA
jgi:hypothetical protein